MPEAEILHGAKVTQNWRVVLNDDQAATLDDMAVAKRNGRDWNAIAARHRETILESLPEGENLDLLNSSGEVLATITEAINHRFSVDLLKAAHPDLDLSPFYTVGASRTIRTKG